AVADELDEPGFLAEIEPGADDVDTEEGERCRKPREKERGQYPKQNDRRKPPCHARRRLANSIARRRKQTGTSAYCHHSGIESVFTTIEPRRAESRMSLAPNQTNTAQIRMPSTSALRSSHNEIFFGRKVNSTSSRTCSLR